MTRFFLQRIEISNFRAYGDNFSLPLPGPGVTILTGPDGAGKSAFFEAIEWALTGRVRRLEALTQESLDRGRSNGLLARREEDVPVAQYGVTLEFVNGEGGSTRIERRAVREQESREQFVEVSSPTRQQLMDLLQAGSWQNEVGDIGEYLRPTHLRGPRGVVFARLLQAVLEVDERRRGAELKRDTLLRLSAARMTIAQGVTQKSSTAARIDRHTHELWMIQSYLHDTKKTIQRIKELDGRIRGLLLAQQEIESCQQAYGEWSKEEEQLRSKEPEGLAGPAEQASHRARQEAIQSSPALTGVAWEQVASHLAESSRRTQLELEDAQATLNQMPDLEYLNDYQASKNARIAQLSSAIKAEHKVVAQLEEELLAAHALQQQHPELLSALGTLPADEANAIDEAVRAVEQLVQHERQLLQSEEPFPGLLVKLNEEITKAQATGAPSPVALDDQRNELAEEESELRQLREQQKRLADELALNEQARWSRWPALLLDEPLQPHDLDHAAELIEVLRSLVRDRKYQVFLSIHDEELADSMRRKMEGAGIECVTCRYSGLGPTGVLYSTV